jgi:hypothetical protein
MRKLAFKFLACTLSVVSLLLSPIGSTRTLSADLPTTQGGVQSANILIKEQDGAPLRILATSIKSAEPKNFKLQAAVQNQGSKEIRAYAITSETATGEGQSGYTQFINLTRRAEIWQPTEIKTIEVSDVRDEPVLSVRLAVDFVEFSDGTTWGPDTNNSRDLLAGQREGARAERQRLRQLLKSKGRAAAVGAIQDSDESLIAPPTSLNRSQKWLEGFRAGAGSVHARLRRVLQGGAAQIELELDKPFDTSEEN